MKWEDKKKVLKHIVKLLLKKKEVTVFIRHKTGGMCCSFSFVGEFLISRRVFLSNPTVSIKDKDVKIDIMGVK